MVTVSNLYNFWSVSWTAWLYARCTSVGGPVCGVDCGEVAGCDGSSGVSDGDGYGLRALEVGGEVS